MDGFRVEAIDHVELFVPDRHEAAAWYRRVLGLDVLPEHEDWAQDPQGPLMISSDRGRTMIALFAGEPQAARPTAGFHRVAFRVNGPTFLAFRDRLREVEAVLRDHDKAWSLYFSDPWGHRLEVTTYDYAAAAQRLRQEG
jgi:catechol 2,3-dioxygenase-like lactoylglutathione lyase family enzyme